MEKEIYYSVVFTDDGKECAFSGPDSQHIYKAMSSDYRFRTSENGSWKVDLSTLKSIPLSDVEGPTKKHSLRVIQGVTSRAS